MKYKGVPEDYKTNLDNGAKNFALVKEDSSTIVESIKTIWQICEDVCLLESRGEYAKAAELLSFYWKGIGEPVSLDGLNSIEKANLLLVVGSIASALGGTEQIKDSQESARDYLGLAERLFDENCDSDGKAKCLNKVAVTYWRNGDLSTARIYLDESLNHAVTYESKAIALLNTAMIESVLKRNFSALNFYEKAYKYIGNISRLTEGSIRNGIGLTFKNIGKIKVDTEKSLYFKKAIAEFEEALICYDEVNNKRFAAATRNNIGYLYYEIGLYESAIKVLETAKTQFYQVKDKHNIGLVFETLARVYYAKGKLKSAVSSSTAAVQNLRINENSNSLANALITYGKILARSGRRAEAKTAFAEAEEKANYIQDSELALQIRVFALRELFSDYAQTERISIYTQAIERLVDTQDREVQEALDEIHELIVAGDQPDLVADPVVSEPAVPSFSLGEALKTIEREYIEQAIAATNGNQTQTAEMLGLKRQTFFARIKKDFPDLLPKLQQIGKAKTCEIFPSHLIEPAPALEGEKLAVTILENDFGDLFRAGDALVIKLGSWQSDRVIAIQPIEFSGLKIGFLRATGGDNFALESASGELFSFSAAGLSRIIGEVVGFCPRGDYDKYMKKRMKGESVVMPVTVCNTEKVSA
ncbi:MAG TPA: helix-turn-helix domain-containing protein [Pyrinomonadaceae bacterium]